MRKNEDSELQIREGIERVLRIIKKTYFSVKTYVVTP